ncbi:MAG: methyltransferase domain-containing protein [Bacteroidota bacterium]
MYKNPNKPEITQLSSSKQVSMSDEWYELTDFNHFWIKWRFIIAQKLLKPSLSTETKILEIGCGNGLVMWQFEKGLGLIIEGCDLNLFALENRLNISGKVFLYDIFDLHPNLLGKYDIVLLLDVLEHIDDDSVFLKTALEYLKPGGQIVVGVPAHQYLFSKYDLIVGHKRRYNSQQLNLLLKSANLVDVESRYWGFSLLPLALLRKIHLKFLRDNKVIRNGFKPPHRFFNWVFIILMKIETTVFEKVTNGISIIVIGRKPFNNYPEH